MDVPRVFLTGTPSRLNILDKGGIKVKSNDNIAICNVKPLFSNRGGEKAVEMTVPEIHNSEELLSD